MAVPSARCALCVALAWYMGAIVEVVGVATSDSKGRSRSGRLLRQRQPLAASPAPAVAATPQFTPIGASSGAAAHIFDNIQKLKQEAANAVLQESSLITSVALRKEQEARDIIEKEIPLAAKNDTAETSQEVAKAQAELDKATHEATGKAQKALDTLQAETTNAINVSTAFKVDQVEKEAEQSVMFISNHSKDLQAEADALAKEAKGAANFSQQASENSKLWVKELPVKEAADAVKSAHKASEESIQLRHEYEDTRRMSKLAGNLALDTIRISNEAAAKIEKARQEATQTAEQAAQNALLLNTIRGETKKVSQAAMATLA